MRSCTTEFMDAHAVQQPRKTETDTRLPVYGARGQRLLEGGQHFSREELVVLHLGLASRAMRMLDRRPTQYVDMLQALVNERAELLAAECRIATDGKPADERVIDVLEMAAGGLRVVGRRSPSAA